MNAPINTYVQYMKRRGVSTEIVKLPKSAKHSGFPKQILKSDWLPYGSLAVWQSRECLHYIINMYVSLHLEDHPRVKKAFLNLEFSKIF